MLLKDLLRYQPIEPATISDGWNYFFLFLLFASIIISVVVIIYFAKWLTLGPKFKKKWAKRLGRNKSNDHVHGVQVVKGKEVVIQSDYEEELRKKIEEAHSPQEKLDYQSRLDSHIKQKEKAEREVREAEEAKLAKIEEKAERARIQKEAKEEAKKLKEDYKQNKNKDKEKGKE